MLNTFEMPTSPWSLSSEETLKALATDAKLGLSSDEAARRKQQLGGNEIPEPPDEPLWKKYWGQLTGDAVVRLLLIGDIVYLPTGAIPPADGRVIAAVRAEEDDSMLTGEPPRPVYYYALATVPEYFSDRSSLTKEKLAEVLAFARSAAFMTYIWQKLFRGFTARWDVDGPHLPRGIDPAHRERTQQTVPAQTGGLIPETRSSTL